MRIPAVLAMVALTMAAGCGVNADSAGHGGGGDLAGRTFLSESVSHDGEQVDLVDGTLIRMEFTTDGRLVVNAGCNTLFSDVSTAGGILAASGVGGTEMGCDQARHEQDAWLTEFLESQPAWHLDGDRLTLAGESTEITLLDREVADPDRPITQTRWVVDTIIVGEVASSMVADTDGTAWLVIGSGSFDASSGCRDITGSVEVSDDRLRFSDTVQTDPACPPEWEQIDEVMRQIFTGEVEYAIQAGRLQIAHPDGVGLGLHADE